MAWDELADAKSLKAAEKALGANGIEVIISENEEDAKKKAVELIPEGAEVFTVTSTTVDTIGLTKELNDSGRYDSVRKRLSQMSRNTHQKEMKSLGAVPDWVVGSVHAVTEDGQVMVASQSGSQLPAYLYGAAHVIWIVGTQKIVKNLDQGMKRIYEYTLPLENERAKKAYGTGSFVSKMAIINRESAVGRVTVIFVKERLGF